jgi:hypothetical protein
MGLAAVDGMKVLDVYLLPALPFGCVDRHGSAAFKIGTGSTCRADGGEDDDAVVLSR